MMRLNGHISWALWMSGVCAGAVFPGIALGASEIVVNELMWDGVEYIELFNAGGEDVQLAGWKLTRQQQGKEEKEIAVLGEEDAIAAGDYWLIERREEATSIAADTVSPSVVLVNGGERVRLYNAEGKVVDSVNGFQNWLAGENTDTGVAMERIDAQGSGEAAGSWQTSSGAIGGRSGTPGAVNSHVEKDSGNVLTDALPAEPSIPYSDTVVVSEALPNPAGRDSEGEWIELYNGGSSDVRLGGWQLDDEEGGSSPFTIPDDAVIVGKSYRVFNRGETGLALNNNGDQVRLLSPDGQVRSQVSYDGPAGEGWSHNWVGGSGWSTTLTPGGANIISVPLESERPIELEVEDDEENVYEYSSAIFVNEFLADPAGSDPDGEFIELINTGRVGVSLYGWQLDDEEEGSRAYVFDAEAYLSAGEVRSFPRSETGIALNNDGDTVRLLDPKEKVVSSFIYSEKVPEGQSYNWDGQGEYFLSDVLTPGEKNVISGDGSVVGAKTSLTSVEQIREMEKGAEVTFEGVVVAPPGILGKTVMYVMDGDGGGIQVYSSKGEFGDAELGMRVQVKGEVSTVGDEARVKISDTGGVVIIGEEKLPAARQVATGEVGEEYEGLLIRAAGRVTRSSGSTFYINDGSGEVRIVVKSSTGIDKPTTKRDTPVTIVGIVSQTRSGYRILPRFQDDVRVGLVAGISDELPEALEGAVPAVGFGGISTNPFANTSDEQVDGASDALPPEKRNLLVMFGLGLGVAYVVRGAVKGEPVWGGQQLQEFVEKMKRKLNALKNQE